VAAFSAGVPLTAAVLASAGGHIRCAALYGPLDDLEPDPALPPLLVVGADQDHPELNRTIDEFVSAAARHVTVELVHQPNGHHAFDVADDTGPLTTSSAVSSPSYAAISGPDIWPVAWTGMTDPMPWSDESPPPASCYPASPARRRRSCGTTCIASGQA
jgi:dienelactone hydrolase